MQIFHFGKTSKVRFIFLLIGLAIILSIIACDQYKQGTVTKVDGNQMQAAIRKQLAINCKTIEQEIPENCVLLDEQIVTYNRIRKEIAQDFIGEWPLATYIQQDNDLIILGFQKKEEEEKRRQQEFIEAKRKEPKTLEAVFESEYTTLYELEPYLNGDFEARAELVKQFLSREVLTINRKEEEKRLAALQQAFKKTDTKILEVISLLKGKYEDNLWLLSHLMRGEALELTDEIQQAQAWVVITRAVSPLLSDGTGDLANAIFRGKQYTCVWDGSFWQEVDAQCIQNAENYLKGEMLEPDRTLNGYFIGTAPENKNIVETYEVQNWEKNAQKDIVTIYVCDRYHF